MWVIKNFSNSCGVSLTYVLHLCTCAYAQGYGVVGILNFLYGPGFLDITYMMAYLILD